MALASQASCTNLAISVLYLISLILHYRNPSNGSAAKLRNRRKETKSLQYTFSTTSSSACKVARFPSASQPKHCVTSRRLALMTSSWRTLSQLHSARVSKLYDSGSLLNFCIELTMFADWRNVANLYPYVYTSSFTNCMTYELAISRYATLSRCHEKDPGRDRLTHGLRADAGVR